MTSANKMEIEPCPFCCSDSVTVKEFGVLGEFRVFCESCESYGPYEKNKKDAINSWNIRCMKNNDK